MLLLLRHRPGLHLSRYLRPLGRHHATHSRTPLLPPAPLLRPLRTWKPLLLTFSNILAWVSATALLNTKLCTIISITGPSMYPFLNTDFHTSTLRDWVFLSLYRPTQNLQRGMVIAFWSPRNPENLAIKRVVAVEGDRVVTKEPYPLGVVDVPVGCVWVEGEHPMSRERSLDSNWYGPVSKSLVVGRAVGVVWPWRRRGWIRWEDWRGSPRVKEGANKVENYEFF